MTLKTTVKGFSKTNHIAHKMDSGNVRTLPPKEQITEISKIITEAELPKEEQERFISLVRTLVKYNV